MEKVLKDKVQNFIDYMEESIDQSKHPFIELSIGQDMEFQKYINIIEGIVDTRVYKEMKEQLEDD